MPVLCRYTANGQGEKGKNRRGVGIHSCILQPCSISRNKNRYTGAKRGRMPMPQSSCVRAMSFNREKAKPEKQNRGAK